MSLFFIFSTLIFLTFQNDNIILIDKLFKAQIETKLYIWVIASNMIKKHCIIREDYIT